MRMQRDCASISVRCLHATCYLNAVKNAEWGLCCCVLLSVRSGQGAAGDRGEPAAVCGPGGRVGRSWRTCARGPTGSCPEGKGEGGGAADVSDVPMYLMHCPFLVLYWLLFCVGWADVSLDA